MRVKRKLTPKVVRIKPKKLDCGHFDDYLNLMGICTKCEKPEPEPKATLETRYTQSDYYTISEPVITFRPSVVILAFNALRGELKTDFAGHYFLWNNGWVRATLTQVMIAANTALASRNEDQIDRNPAWIVK